MASINQPPLKNYYNDRRSDRWHDDEPSPNYHDGRDHRHHRRDRRAHSEEDIINDESHGDRIRGPSHDDHHDHRRRDRSEGIIINDRFNDYEDHDHRGSRHRRDRSEDNIIHDRFVTE